MKKVLIISLAIIVIIALAVSLSVVNKQREINKSNVSIPASSSGDNETNITSNITAYECLDSSHCASNQSCINNNCTNLSCNDCQYLRNHECLSYECCKSEDCLDNQTCSDHNCINLDTVNESLAFETVVKDTVYYGVTRMLDIVELIGKCSYDGLIVITNYSEWANLTSNGSTDPADFKDFNNYFLVAVLLSSSTAPSPVEIMQINQSKTKKEVYVYFDRNIYGGGKTIGDEAWHIVKIKKSDLLYKEDLSFISFCRTRYYSIDKGFFKKSITINDINITEPGEWRYEL